MLTGDSDAGHGKQLLSIVVSTKFGAHLIDILKLLAPRIRKMHLKRQFRRAYG